MGAWVQRGLITMDKGRSHAACVAWLDHALARLLLP